MKMIVYKSYWVREQKWNDGEKAKKNMRNYDFKTFVQNRNGKRKE